MAWDFENITQFSDDGNVTAVVWDGFYVWVFHDSASVTLIGLIDCILDAYHDPNIFFERVNPPSALPTVSTITIVGISGIVDACYWDGHLYALTPANTIVVVDNINLGSPTATISIPTTVLGKICAANNKLWMVGFDADANDQQTLYVYDIIHGTWSSSVLPGSKQQSTARDIIDGLDGRVYITSANDHCIHSYDHVSNTFIKTYPTNRYPYKIAVNQAKLVYVTGDAQTNILGGTVSTFDQSSEIVTPYCGAGGQHEILFDDEEKNQLWMLGRTAGLTRVTKSTKATKILNSGRLCWELVSGLTSSVPWTVGNSYSTGALVVSPYDGNIYQCTYPGTMVATQYDCPGVPDDGVLTLWNSHRLAIGDPKQPIVDTMATTPIHHGILTPSFSYEVWNGSGFTTVTVPKHLIAVGTNTISVIRVNDLVRTNNHAVQGGSALISRHHTHQVRNLD